MFVAGADATPDPNSNINLVAPGVVLKFPPSTVMTVPPVTGPQLGCITPYGFGPGVYVKLPIWAVRPLAVA
jgi:hypothetical protein